MPQTIEAIYRNGVFEPTGPVEVRNGESVTLDVRRHDVSREPEWLTQLREGRERLAAKYGVFPDCTPGIAEDRLRDICVVTNHCG